MKWFYPLLLLLLLPTDSQADVPSTLAERCVQHYAAHYRVPPELIAALIDVESRWNPRALSNKGAMGLMQLMPDTARRYGAIQPFDVEQNIAAGTRYVTTLMWEFRGDPLTRLEDDQISVNIIPKKLQDSENTALTTPFKLTGTAEELDRDLPSAIVDFVAAHLQLKSTLERAKAEKRLPTSSSRSTR
jgi:PRTRC genetic system protein E